MGRAALHARTALLAIPSATLAHDVVNVERIDVNGHYDSSVGTSDAASEGSVTAKLIDDRPVLRPGEVLETVPGVVVTQHSGDGKANQYFLRGFNLDHGTDFAICVDGVPVNLPTHGHGQGYSDLNFLIPELVERIAVPKGPYFADEGDFSAAGAAHISYLEASLPGADRAARGRAATATGARSSRLAGASATGNLLCALELGHDDGPWDDPGRLRKLQRRSCATPRQRARTASALTAMGYDGALELDRPGRRSARSTTGARRASAPSTRPTAATARALQPLGEWHRSDDAGRTRGAAPTSIYYGLDLFSNFTYFLDDPENGDQFEQRTDAGSPAPAWRGAGPRAWRGRDVETQPSACSCGTTTSIRVGLYHTRGAPALGDDRARTR